MKAIILIIIFISLIANAHASEETGGLLPDSPLYTLELNYDNFRLDLSQGESKALLAQQIKNERILEAKNLIEQKKDKIGAENSLIDSQSKSKILQQEITPDIKLKTQSNIKLLKELKIRTPSSWTKIKKKINNQIIEEEIIRIKAEKSRKILELCEDLALRDYELMMQHSYCNPNSAPKWLINKINFEFNLNTKDSLNNNINIVRYINDITRLTKKISELQNLNEIEIENYINSLDENKFEEEESRITKTSTPTGFFIFNIINFMR